MIGRLASNLVLLLAVTSASDGAFGQTDAPATPGQADTAEPGEGSADGVAAETGRIAMDALPSPRTLEDGSVVTVVAEDWDADGFADWCGIDTVAPGDLLVSRGSDTDCDGVPESVLNFASCPQPHDRCVHIGGDVGIAPDDLVGDAVLNRGILEIPSGDPTRWGLPAELVSGEPLPGAPSRACTAPSVHCRNPATMDCRCDEAGTVFTLVFEPEGYGSNRSYRRLRYDAGGRVVLQQEDFGGSLVTWLRRLFYDATGRVAASVMAEPGGELSVTHSEWEEDRLVRVREDLEGDGIWDQITEHVWEGDVLVQSRIDLSGRGELVAFEDFIRDESGSVVAVRYSEPDGAEGQMTCYLSAPCSQRADLCPDPDWDTCETVDVLGANSAR